jgi:uncharacterized protein (DUF111 family)
MKIKDIDYYAKFIFSSIDGQNCLSTTDKDVLNEILSEETDEIKTGFTIGDVIFMKSFKDLKFKITDICIRRLVDDTKMVNIGFDFSDCKNWSGKNKEPLFIIQITIEKV